ncbi:MAG: glycosyltransferase [Proteobacteria bacterium]|nr:MAG: glycosyltransferase [Pseudomonadota bacterium]
MPGTDPKRPVPASRPDCCLAMLVRSEARILKRCLLSARPFISSWLIFDTGFDDGSETIAKDVLRGVPGSFERVPFTYFSDLRNRLFQAAASRASTVLVMDADEIITVDDPASLDVSAGGIACVETGPDDYSFHLPRLLSSSARVEYVGMVYETLGTCVEGGPSVAGARLHHMQDGYRHRAAHDLDRILLEAERSNPADGTRHLAFAREALRRSALDEAIEHFGETAANSVTTFEKWYGHYMRGLLLERVSNRRQQAVDSLLAAHDAAPDRLESLHHLIRMAAAEEDLERAYELSRVATAPFDYDRQPYFEPPIHAFASRFQHIDLCIRTNRFDEARPLLNETEQQFDLSFSANEELKRLKARLPKPVQSTSKGGSDAPAPLLTIGMATYDDFDGVYFTINAIVLYHPEVLDDTEFVIIDNHPGGPCSKSLRKLADDVPRCRYIAYDEAGGTSQPRNEVFAQARGTYVLCLDSHVQLVPGALSKLLGFFKDNPDSRDLIQGPLYNHGSNSNHMKPEWRLGFLGTWGNMEGNPDAPDEPFEIEMQGLGLFACRRDAWPGFNSRFRGFGGEEGYIQQKFRNAGARTLCLPALMWMHRFARPMGPKYKLSWGDRIRNYLIGADEVNTDLQPIEKHFTRFLSSETGLECIISTQAEIDGPLYRFDAIYLLHEADAQPDDAMKAHLGDLGIETRTIFKTLERTENPEAGRASAHREILENADKRNYRTVLILRDPGALNPRVLSELRQPFASLDDSNWGIVLVNQPSSPVGVVAIAYHQSRYSTVLNDLPAQGDVLPPDFKTIEYFYNTHFAADIIDITITDRNQPDTELETGHAVTLAL